MCVAALKRLFEHKPGSPRRFRHEIYARIAKGEPTAWALCGTSEQREKALGSGGGSGVGSRPAAALERVWARALAAAFNGLAFQRVTGSKGAGNPNGYWTTALVEI